MSTAVATEIVARPVVLARDRAIAAAVGFAALLWFVWLSGWLGVQPGAVFVKRQNVLFNSDTSIWLGKIVGHEKAPTKAIHPLEVVLWRPPVQALSHALTTFLPAEYAGILAARLLVASLAGIGVGLLAFLALKLGIDRLQCGLLFLTYFLFTSSTTIALPEHFGISNGLLSIAFVGPIIFTDPAVRLGLLGIMTVLCGGTTITNVLYPAAAFLQYGLRSTRARMVVLLSAIPVGLAMGWFLFRHSFTIHAYVSGYSNFRLVRHPLSALVYAVYTLVAPAVGPSPLILRYPGWDMVCYEPAYQPLRLSYYLGIQAVGAIAWCILLVLCVYHAMKDTRVRAYVWLPMGWLLFSILFHNIWGDELQLYAPHWSWALMALVILGARHLSRRLTAVLVAPMMVSQIYTLLAIKKALLTVLQ
jgi:hypothetical protein